MIAYILMMNILYSISKYIKIKFTKPHTKNKNIFLFIHFFMTKSEIIFIFHKKILNPLINIYFKIYFSKRCKYIKFSISFFLCELFCHIYFNPDRFISVILKKITPMKLIYTCKFL